MGYFGRRPSPAPLSFDDVSDGGSIVIDNAGTIGSVSDTDALSVSSGGVLNFTQEPTVTGEDIYYQGNILGTVSQSGGTPTGAIIEEDSNANGSYVKFADGTMIATRSSGTINTTNNPVPNYWRGTTGSLNLPVTFVATPIFVLGPSAGTSVDAVSATVRSSTTSSVQITAWGVNNAQDSDVGILAIGRWF